MDHNDTLRQLDEITDPGLFERLATAVLRELHHRYRHFVHTGVNVEGKTVTSPSDAIKYIRDKGSLRMVAAHHTIGRRKDLQSKWLADLKTTRHEFVKQRNRIPELRATLILTTNREPPEQVVHKLHVAAYEAEIDVTIHSRSDIAHFLDVDRNGQWLRHMYLGVAPTRLSKELLRAMGPKSMAVELSDAESWVSRSLDDQLAIQSLDPVSFIVGESGMGKTVACIKCLEEHVSSDGLGLLVKAEVLGESRSLADAVESTLQELHPTLATGEGREALSLVSESAPLLVVVEDVSRSASPTLLLEKLVSWGRMTDEGKESVPWRVLCPVWPRTAALLSDKAYQAVRKSMISVGPFSEEEGIAAVQRQRAEPLTALHAKAIANALGYDPLLIALHSDDDWSPDPTNVIRSFVEGSLRRLSTGGGKYTTGEYRVALRGLSLMMLERKQLQPTFADVVKCMGKHSSAAQGLRETVKEGEVARLDGSGEQEKVTFRHDRVRDYLLADAIAHMMQRHELNPAAIPEPYFAEVIGIAMAGAEATKDGIDHVARVNPLALFAAMRHFSQPLSELQHHIVDVSTVWANSAASRDPRNDSLRQGVLRVLAECEGVYVRSLAERIDGTGSNWWALRARFRNGDVSAGIVLCAFLEPGVTGTGHVELAEHVFGEAGPEALQALGKVLRNKSLQRVARTGALRLAGYAGCSSLSEPLQESWRNDEARSELLLDYLWACAQCCGHEPGTLLDPILDEWATMPEKGDKGHYSRGTFGEYAGIAFREKMPESAIDYFLCQSKRSELRWPLLLMLHRIDNPNAFEFVVKELARRDEAGMSTFPRFAVDEWKERPKYGGKPMQAASRQRLHDLWSSEKFSGHVRRNALQLWSAKVERGDIAVLKTVDPSSELGDVALFERLRRGDQTAIQGLMDRLESGGARYWWQAGRYLWSNELTECLDHALGLLATEPSETKSGMSEDYWMLPELLTRIPRPTAEQLIRRHWGGLSRSGEYIQVALYLASSDLLAAVRETVERCEDPKPLFAHLGMHLGLRVVGRRGITRIGQMEALLPYLDHLSDHDVFLLWEACNDNGWFDWRREYLDTRAKQTGARFVDAASALKELDKELSRDQPFFRLDQWGERLLRTGVALDDMMQLVKEWLGNQPDSKALRMAVDLVIRFGRRRHLAILRSHEPAQRADTQAIIDSASFALRLRSLE